MRIKDNNARMLMVWSMRTLSKIKLWIQCINAHRYSLIYVHLYVIYYISDAFYRMSHAKKNTYMIDYDRVDPPLER